MTSCSSEVCGLIQARVCEKTRGPRIRWTQRPAGGSKETPTYSICESKRYEITRCCFYAQIGQYLRGTSAVVSNVSPMLAPIRRKHRTRAEGEGVIGRSVVGHGDLHHDYWRTGLATVT